MSNRIPLVVLGMLVLAALVWRIAYPPEPEMPGPLGVLPSWISVSRIGDLGASGVSPDASKWAGAWTVTDKDGFTRSAVVIVDLVTKQAQRYPLGDGFATGLFWRDNDYFCVLLADKADPESVGKTRLRRVKVGAATSKVDTADLDKDVTAILAWPAGSDNMIARLAGSQVSTAVLGRGGVSGNVAVLGVPSDAKFYPIAALSPSGDSYVVAIEKSEIGGEETFYAADTKTGVVKELFTSQNVPGIIDGMWLSPNGVLIVASERGKFHVVRYDPASQKVVAVSKNAPLPGLAKDWPDAPASMTFTTYTGAFQIDLKTGKSKRILKFDTSDRDVTQWAAEAQDGRLYPRKGGDYTSVSYAAKLVDIRIIDKDGESAEPLLPRR